VGDNPARRVERHGSPERRQFLKALPTIIEGGSGQWLEPTGGIRLRPTAPAADGVDSDITIDGGAEIDCGRPLQMSIARRLLLDPAWTVGRAWSADECRATSHDPGYAAC